MSVIGVGSPFAIVFPSGNAITQIRDLSPAHNFQDADEIPAGQNAPFFTGSDGAAPDIPIATPQIADVLSLFDTEGICKYFGDEDENTDVYYRAGKSGGMREDVDETVHWRARCQENAFVYWTGLQARQGQTAEISLRILPVYNGSVDPLVFSSGESLEGITSAVQHRFTLGPIAINGSALSSETDLSWNNNISTEEIAAGGGEFPEYRAIDAYRPQLVLQTRNLNIPAAFGARGTDLTSLTVYLRKRKQSGINFANGSTVHVKFTASAGTIKARGVRGNNAMAEVFIQLRKSSMGANPFTITLNSAIT